MTNFTDILPMVIFTFLLFVFLIIGTSRQSSWGSTHYHGHFNFFGLSAQVTNVGFFTLIFFFALVIGIVGGLGYGGTWVLGSYANHFNVLPNVPWWGFTIIFIMSSIMLEKIMAMSTIPVYVIAGIIIYFL